MRTSCWQAAAKRPSRRWPSRASCPCAPCARARNKTRASTPVRSGNVMGFVMGEGAGILVLEGICARQGARRPYLRRDNRLWRDLRCSPHHRSAGRWGSGGARAMVQGGGRTPGLKPEDIDYINAHGTSTPLNDPYGRQPAVKLAFGEHAHHLADVFCTKSTHRSSAGGKRRPSKRSSP